MRACAKAEMGEALTTYATTHASATPVTGINLHPRVSSVQGGGLDVVLRLLFSRRRTGVRTDAITMDAGVLVVHWLPFTSAYC